MSTWKDALPEELRNAPFFEKAESLDAAIGHIKHAANHVGSSIRLPDKSASDEQLREFASKVLERFPNLQFKPEGDDLPPDEYDNAEAEAAKLTKAQIKALYGPRERQEQEAREAQEADIAELRKEWGKAFEDKISSLRTFAEESGAPQSLLDAIANRSLPAESFKWLDRFSRRTEETASNRGRDGTPTLRLTPEEAEDKIGEIMRNPAHWDSSSPDYARLMKRRMELERLITPDDAG